jgi:hypothetical protein
MSCLGTYFIAKPLTSTSIGELALTAAADGLVHEFAH